MYSGYRSMSPFWSAANTTSVVPKFSLYDIWYPSLANAWPYTCPRTCAPGRFFEPIVSEPLLPPWPGALAPPTPAVATTTMSPISIAPSVRPGNRTRALIIAGSFLLGPVHSLPRRARRHSRRGCDLRDRVFDAAPGTRTHTQAARHREVLQPSEPELERDRKQGHEHRAREHLHVVLGGEAVDDEASEPAPSRVRGKRRGGDDRDRARSDPGPHQGQRDRRLDTAQELPPRHAHAAGGLAHLRVDPDHADVGVGEHRRDRKGNQHDERRERPDERERSRRLAEPEDLHHEDEQRERGQRSSDVRDVDGGDASLAHVTDEKADRQRDQGRGQDGDNRDLDVLGQAMDHAVVPAPVRPVSEPVDDVPEEAHA